MHTSFYITKSDTIDNYLAPIDRDYEPDLATKESDNPSRIFDYFISITRRGRFQWLPVNAGHKIAYVERAMKCDIIRGELKVPWMFWVEWVLHEPKFSMSYDRERDRIEKDSYKQEFREWFDSLADNEEIRAFDCHF